MEIKALRHSWVGLLLLSALSLAACGGGGSAPPGGPVPPPPATPTVAPGQAQSVTITSDHGVILSGVGATYQLQAGLSGSQSASITWTSSNPSVASVSTSGLVTALSPVGSAVITASSAGASSDYATTTIATPANGTILVNSGDVISATGTQAVLTSDATTQRLLVVKTVPKPRLHPKYVSGDHVGSSQGN